MKRRLVAPLTVALLAAVPALAGGDLAVQRTVHVGGDGLWDYATVTDGRLYVTRLTYTQVVDLGGKPEFLAADGRGTVYCNVKDRNEVAVVDLKTMKVTARYPTGADTAPHGLALDVEHGRLFVGCRNRKLVVLDTTAGGKVLAELPIGSGNDACGFDPGTGLAYASQGDGTMAVVKETAPGNFEVVQTVRTPRGSRTLAVDRATHTVYLPGGEFGPAAATQHHPVPKPDTFMLTVVGPAVAGK